MNVKELLDNVTEDIQKLHDAIDKHFTIGFNQMNSIERSLCHHALCNLKKLSNRVDGRQAQPDQGIKGEPRAEGLKGEDGVPVKIADILVE